MNTVVPWSADSAQAIIDGHAGLEGAAMPILNALQRTFGFIHEDAIPMVARALNLSRADVYGIVTFYHDYRREPPGRHVLRLCRAEACQSMGGDALAERAQKKLGATWNETTRDGAVTLEPVFCLGMCACAPSAMLDGRPIARLDDARLDALIEGVKR